MPRTLFWDFHGTLIKPGSIWSWNLLQAALTVQPDCGLTLADIRRHLDNDGFPWNHPERTYLAITQPDDWWLHVARLFVNTYRRCGLADHLINQIVPLVRGRILDPANYELFDGAVQVLAELKQSGWQHILVSNNFPELADICQAIGIGQFFTASIVSALVGYDKPRAEIYQLAREAAGHPATCFMIGDNPVADIIGAQAVGIPGILVNCRQPEDDVARPAAVRCADLPEVRDWLMRSFS